MLSSGQLKWLHGSGIQDVKLVNLSWQKLIAPNKKGGCCWVTVAWSLEAATRSASTSPTKQSSSTRQLPRHVVVASCH